MPESSQKTVRTAIAPLLAEPRAAASMTSQLVAGDVVAVIDGRGDWLHVRGADDYEGWMHAGYLMPSVGNEREWALSLGCTVRDVLGVTRELPLGARIAPGTEVITGATFDAPTCVLAFPRVAAAVARSAESLFTGASYLWGGVTPWGCDCSGFVQRIHALHGLRLPRDAWQQAAVGVRVGVTTDAEMQVGDLLFFSDREDGRVTHVGLALDGQRMVHSSLMRGGVAIEQLQSADPYVTRLRAQCVDVRRMIAD